MGEKMMYPAGFLAVDSCGIALGCNVVDGYPRFIGGQFPLSPAFFKTFPVDVFTPSRACL